MSWIPYLTETRVSLYDRAKLIQRLKNISLSPEETLENPEDRNKIFFNGYVRESSFRLSLALRRPNNYIPLVCGDVENTSSGSIIFITYKLFPGTVRLLTFWSAISFLFTLFFAIPYQAYWYAAISFSLGLVNYIISLENFKAQVRKTQRALQKALE
ncbi:MAG: hypothetical protein JJU28_08630 [Cyclobacteriaceae bacterium]|nr:hypothetical protein [Cyclobacteriaceae bacterium]